MAEQLSANTERFTAASAGRSIPARKDAINLLDTLFALSILIYPANAAIAFDPLGEARSEPYILINLALLPLAVISLYRRGVRRESILALFALSLLGAVIITGIANAGSIFTAELKGRTGISRLISATVVPMFGFYFSYLVYAYCRVSYRRYLMTPLFWGAVLVIVVGDVELVTWKVDAIHTLYLNFSHVVHALMRRGEYVTGRIQSITYEASNFGMYAIFTLPWLWVFANHYRHPLSRAICWLLFVNLIALSFFSGRTSLVGIVPVVLIMIYLRLSLVSRGPSFLFFHYILLTTYVALNVIPIGMIAIFQDNIAAAALSSDNVSNVSRFGTMAIQINEFLAHPIFGVGMGQYPFWVKAYFPSWAYTWEFEKWLTDPEASFFPSFSLYSRIAAELGSIGFLVWLAFSCLLLRNVMLAARLFWLQYRVFPYIGACIACCFFGLLFSGWVIASYRIPYIWFAFGFAAAYAKFPEFVVWRGTAYRSPERIDRGDVAQRGAG